MVSVLHKLRQAGLAPWLATLLVALMVMGCGGGANTASNGVGVGGTGAAATGPVSGYGSIIVNDVHFDFSQAQFTTEDAADGGDQSDEALPSNQVERPVGFGAIVNITSGDISSSQASAKLITLVSALKGPVQSVTQGASGTCTLQVLNQTVDVDSSTQPVSGGVSPCSLSPGNNVVVYANLDKSTTPPHYKATRVEYRNQLLSYKVRGYVTFVGANSLTINGTLTLVVPGSIRPANLAVGQLVRVRTLATAPSLPVSAIKVVPIGTNLSDNVQARQDGVLVAVNDGGYEMDGTPVNLSGAQVSGTIGNGQRVELIGVMRNGVLVVSTATGNTGPNFVSAVTLRGSISGLNTTTGQFTLHGTTVLYDQNTVLDQGVNLANDQSYTIVGVLVPTSNATTDVIRATRISLATTPSEPQSH